MLYAFSGSSCIMYLFFVHFDIVVFLFPVKFISRLGKVCVKCCICVCIVVAFAKISYQVIHTSRLYRIYLVMGMFGSLFISCYCR